MIHLSKFSICIPIILVMIFDLVFTIAGQPDGYWENYNLCHESSPIGKLLLTIGPIYFIASFVLYMISILVLVIKLPNRFSSILIVAIFLGHAWGGASWVPILYRNFSFAEINKWYLCMGYFIFVSLISNFYFSKTNKGKPYERKP